MARRSSSSSSFSPTPAEAFVPFEPTPRQAEILERAFELIQESGLAGLTLKKVAARVGFTEAAIYRHFPNKAALVDALLRRLGGRLLGPISELAQDSSLPPEVRLERMVRHHVRLLRETQGLPLLLVAEALATGDRAIVARMRSIMAVYTGHLGELLDQLRLPLTEPARLQSLLFLGLPAALGLQIRAWPDFGPSDAQIDELVAYYVHALTRAGRPAPEADR